MSAPVPDQSIIERAAAAHAAARARLEDQRAATKAAEDALARAEQERSAAIARAARGEPGLTPADAQRALAEAREAAALARELEIEMASAAEQARRVHVASEAEAWSVVLQHGVAGRIAACEKFEAGLALLRAAMDDSAQANRHIENARAHRCTLGFDGAKLAPIVHHGPATSPAQPAEFSRSLRSPAAERQLWGAAA